MPMPDLTRLKLATYSFLCAATLLMGAQRVHAQALETDPQWLRQWVESSTQSGPGLPPGARLQVEVGQLDPRLNLAPCARIEPYVPNGARLWGRSRAGLRCVEGPVRWNVFIPLTVHVYARGWVVSSPRAEGDPLENALAEAEVDLAAELSPALLDPAQWQGQVAARNLAPGQVLRAGLIRPAQLFPSGALVRVQMEGSGFSVSAEGQALAPGLRGRPVRVRLDNGRIVSGNPVDERTVTAGI